MPPPDVYELTTQSISEKPISLLLTELMLEAIDSEPPTFARITIPDNGTVIPTG